MNRMMNDEKCNEHGWRSFPENGIIIGGLIATSGHIVVQYLHAKQPNFLS